jgi:Sulfatase
LVADRGARARRFDGLRGRQLVRFAALAALIVLGVSGLAVTQPILDLLGSNPEFFVAGNYSTTQIVALAVVIALLPPSVGILLVVSAAFADRHAGTVTLAGVTAVFAAGLVLAVLRSLGVDALWLVAVVAIGLALTAGWLVGRFRAARLFAAYLSAANLLFVGTFLFFSQVSSLVVGNGATNDIGGVSVPDLDGPVVVIILDELPAATIMGGDGTINEERYPGFARLAGVSRWFRNASSRANWTPTAVPAILTGTTSAESIPPTYDNYPRNLFTLLGNDLPIRRYEPITDLCPEVFCSERKQAPMRQALSDASIVYGHRVLPSSLRDHLPPIDNSWGAYGAEHDNSVASGDEDGADEDGDGAADTADPMDVLFRRGRALSDEERSPRGQAATMAEEVAVITGDPALHLLHINLPHYPWTLSPSGHTTTYSQANRPEDLDRGQPGYDFRIRVEYQLHSMQTGAVDALVDEALDHLMSLPAWDDTLLVVTSDHGVGLTPPDVGRRRVTEANRAEVYRVPLFIKAPGQTAGEIRDDSAQTIDIVPSIVDLLGIEVDDDWEFDGHSLYDGSESEIAPLVSTDVDEVLAIAERRAEQFASDDWIGLAAVGEYGDLVGQAVSDLSIGEPSTYSATLRDETLLEDLPTDEGSMPYLLTGTIAGPSDDTPPELVAAVNGRIAGVVGGYNPSGSGWEFIGYVAEFYVDGANTVELYEVSRNAEATTLHPVSR